MDFRLSPFGTILLFIIGGICFPLICFLIARFLRPQRPNAQKLTPYECGEEPVSAAENRFPFIFYITALVFVLFEAELIFLFPLLTVFGEEEKVGTGGTALWIAVEVAIFMAVLFLGLLYVWGSGWLDGIVQKTLHGSSFSPKIPRKLYEQVNSRTYAVIRKKIQSDHG